MVTFNLHPPRSAASASTASISTLIEICRFRQISLASVGYLVFDEADRMLDMGHWDCWGEASINRASPRMVGWLDHSIMI